LLFAWYSQTIAKRDEVQFIFDVFKVSCGAIVSHGFNMLASMYLATKAISGSECGLYAIVFVYECCGITFVQLLMYCVIKFAETQAHVSPS